MPFDTTTTADLDASAASEPVRIRRNDARRLALLMGVVAGAIGALALVGTIFDLGALTSVRSGFVAIKVNSALALILAGTSLGIRSMPAASSWRRRLGSACAAVVTAIGVLTLAEYLFRIDLGIDQLLWREASGAVETVYPGRPAPNTALPLALIGLALLVQEAKGERLRRWSQPLSLVALAIAALGVIGYAQGTALLYGLKGHTPVALNATIALALLACGCLAARPELGIVRVATSDGSGGQLARRLLWVATLGPFLLRLLVAAGTWGSLYDDSFADALHVVLLTGLLVLLVLLSASRLDETDRRRRESERRRFELEADERAASARAQAERAARTEAERLAARAEEGERRASAERERLAVTLRSIGDGVIATDTGACIQVLNPVAEALTGWKAEEAIGRPLGEVFHIIDARTREPREDPVARVLASGTVVGLASHTALVARDGTERSIADSGAPIRDGEGRIVGVILVFRDVTDEERRERALARTQRLESLAVLAGGIAHDFNNLLTGVLANLGLALEEVRGDALVEVLSDAKGAAERASGLTKQLLTFSKGGAPVKEVTELGKLVRETAHFCTHGWPGACRFDLAPDLWRGHVDPGQVAQVVQNVVINAVQAMSSGGTLSIGARNVRVEDGDASGLPAGPYVRIRIADDGPGIPESVQDRIFEPFYSTKPQGSGLGLAVTHSIVSKHDGCIEVTSREGVGTTFDIYFPARPGAPAGAAAQAEPQAVSHARVLVMDDEETIRRATTRTLGAAGYETAAAASGEEAVERFREARASGRPFDLVVLDLTVPGRMGGLAALAALRALDPEIRAIVSSGFSSDPVMASHAGYGFAAVLAKPYQPAELREVVARVLGAKRT